MRYLLFLTVFACFIITLGLSAKDEETLSTLQNTVKDTDYGNYWNRLKAIEKLGEIKTQESTAVLISLLDDKEPPIREAAVMALGKIKDKGLVKWFVEETINNTRANVEVKANAAWALRFIHCEETTLALVKCLSDNDPQVSIQVMKALATLAPANSYSDVVAKKLTHSDAEVRRVAAQTLGLMNAPGINEVLLKKLTDGSALVRATLVEAIARTEKPVKTLPNLRPALSDSAPEVKIAALESIAKEAPEQAVAPAIDLLNDKDWRVRSSAIAILCRVRKVESVEPLINRLAKEPGRLRSDIVETLKSLCGCSFGYDPKSWQNWFIANKNTLKIDDKPGAPPATPQPGETFAVARFFDIPVFGENVIFIIDFSGSMKSEDKKEGKPRIEIAREQLANALKNFTPKMKFNIILMSTEVTKIKKRQAANALLPATEQNRQQALEFVSAAWDKLEEIKRGRGDMYDALMEAFAEKDVDTIFLLSDGKPTYGKFMVPENIMENLSDHNRFRKIVINTICTDSKGAAARLMQDIADTTGGMCIKK